MQITPKMSSSPNLLTSTEPVTSPTTEIPAPSVTLTTTERLHAKDCHSTSIVAKSPGHATEPVTSPTIEIPAPSVTLTTTERSAKDKAPTTAAVPLASEMQITPKMSSSPNLLTSTEPVTSPTMKYRLHP
ncbi:hypothetical protein OSTOST_24276 [Ostertagia ostertagi]